MKKIRMLSVIPTPTDATSLYRAMGPFSRLVRTQPEIEIFSTDKYDWTTMNLTDVMFMQRPFTNNHLEMAALAKRHSKPLVLDYDDDLFSVPESNPTHAIYGKPEIKQNVFDILNMADQIWCSTKLLKEKIETLAPKAKCIVVPNALDFKSFGYTYAKRDEPTNNLVMWRGSRTHDADLMKYLPEICQLVQNNQNYTFHFQGGMPWFLKQSLRKFKNVTTGNPLDPFEYMKMISTVRPCLWMVPLEENEFNKSKSNIAWLEAITSGSVAVCPDWEEWRVPGAHSYSDSESFFKKMDSFLKSKQDPREENEIAWNFITDKLDLEKVNHLREKSIYELAGR